MHPPPKFLKIVATRGETFSLKFNKYRLAAVLFVLKFEEGLLSAKALPQTP